MTQSPTNNLDTARLTVKLLMDAANGYKGRVLDREAVRNICRYIMAMEAASEELFARANYAENMLSAYVNEYGEKLFNELSQEVVDGEIIDETEVGQSSEGDGLDPQIEGEEQRSLLEGESTSDDV